MKKFLSAIICLTMLASAAVLAVSADGRILFEDKFDSMDNDDWGWGPDISNFVVEDGVLVGDPTAVVHQTQYGREASVLRIWDKLACKVDVRINDYEDSTLIGPGLWFKDYNTTYEQDDEGEEDTGEIWNYDYNIVDNTVSLSGDYFSANNIEPIKVKLADGIVKVGPDDKPTTFSLGWRIQPGLIECYFNDQKVITCTQVPADLGTIRPSPILLVNHSCYIEFDNFVVSTPDYNLFNENPDDINNGGNNTQAPATKIVEKIEKGENGETRIVTEIVADTNANTPSSSNGGSNTGDAIVAVAAVMAVAAVGVVVFAKRKEH